MLNKVILIGNLTADPKKTEPKPGLSVCKFSLAINNYYQKTKSVDFINCTAFNKTADNIAKYLKKGSTVAVEGSIRTGSYEKNQIKIYTFEVVTNNVVFLNTRNNSQTQNSSDLSYDDNSLFKNNLKKEIEKSDNEDDKMTFAEDINWGK